MMEVNKNQPDLLVQAFAHAAERRSVTSIENFIDAILWERPDLRKKIAKGKASVEREESANSAYVVFIGDEVFKAPKLKRDMEASASGDEYETVKKVNRNIIIAFEKEVEALQGLKGSSRLIPKVTYIGKGTLFFAMSRKPGVTYESLTAITPLTTEQKRTLARDLIDFIIHMALALPMENGRYAKHSDLHRRNILLDPKTKKLTAVIDFGRIFYFSRDKLGHVGIDEVITKMGEEEFARRKSDIPNPKQVKAKSLDASANYAKVAGSQKPFGGMQ